MNAIVKPGYLQIVVEIRLDNDGSLECDMSIKSETKRITFIRDTTGYPNFYNAAELVYVQIPTAFNSDVEYYYSNKVRRAKMQIQKVGLDFHLLCSYAVRNSTAYIISWVESERGKKLSSNETFDLTPCPITIE